MIFLAPVFADVNGLVKFQENGESEIEAAAMRVQTDKLLNGGTYVQFRGFSDGDRRIQIISNEAQSSSVCQNIWRLVRLSTKFLLSTRDGFYTGVIASLRTDKGIVSFTFIPEEKHS